MRKRISGDSYRARSIDEWCDEVRALGARSLTEWAARSRYGYNVANSLGIQRVVAERLGWRSKLPNGGMSALSNEEAAERFIRRGAKTASDLWRINSPLCIALQRQGRLDAVRELVRARYVTERHRSDLAYYLDRARGWSCFEVWVCADRIAAATARRHGLLDEVKAACPPRPARFSTEGGLVRSLPELVVARLLERSRVRFVVEPEYPFPPVNPRPGHRLRADFGLAGGQLVEVWNTHPHLGPRVSTERGRYYLDRRRLKTRLSGERGLRVLGVEGWILYQHGLECFVAHVRLALQSAAPHLVHDVEARELLSV